MDPRLIETLEREVEGDVRFDPGTRALYATDASIYRVPALGVVCPRHREDVVRTVQIAARFGVPLLPRGGGTGLAGQTVNRALIVDFSRHMAALQIDPLRRIARVEPGVVLDSLNRAAGVHGLQFGPDVATSSRATLGGMIGNNSSGAHSLIYGKTIDHVEALDLVLADGATARADRSEAPALRPLASALAGIVEAQRDEILARYPAVLRRVAGYNLDAFVDRPWHMARLFVGSEGTLAISCGAELDLIPLPACCVIATIAFDDLFEGLAAVPRILAHRPGAIELTDRMLLDLARDAPLHRDFAARWLGDGPTPSALLAVAFYGESVAPLERAVAQLTEDIGELGQVRPLLDAESQRRFWALRKDGLGILLGPPGDAKPLAFVEDTAVDPGRLASYLRELDALVKAEGLQTAYYAHASVGVIHARPVIDLKRASGVAQLRRIAEAVAALVGRYHGATSGEHGDGRARSEFLEQAYGPQLTAAFALLKRVVDPQGLLNPGNIVAPPPMDTALRFGPSYRADPPPANFAYQREGGLARAIEQCNGNGACRALRGGAMCPSFRATRDERHSTRGRANLLREAISGGLPGGADDPALGEALALCLGCKACARECPSAVDMTRMKYDFLAFRHRGGAPLATVVAAALPSLARLGWPFARLAARLDRPAVRRLLERFVGLDHRRPLPRLAPRPARMLLRPAGPLDGPPVALFLDSWTDSFEPQIALAAQRVLVAAGCRVTPVAPGCCGRPALSLGLPGAARRASALLERTLIAIGPDAALVGLEPSCLLTFRDEMPDLLADPRAAALAGRTYLFDEYLAQLGRPLAGRLRPIGRPPLRVHGHCHQQALASLEPTLAILRWIPDVEATALDHGCCGMAGAFGYQHQTYDISCQIGELGLLPDARAAAPGAMVATGFSCRHQLADLAGVTALHPAQLLDSALHPGLGAC